MNPESPSQELVPLKKRRKRIPDKPNYSLNLWSIMKNCIGKELSKIPMPVSISCHQLVPPPVLQSADVISSFIAQKGIKRH